MRSRAALNHGPFRTPLFEYTPRKQGARLEARLSSQPCVHKIMETTPMTAAATDVTVTVTLTATATAIATAPASAAAAAAAAVAAAAAAAFEVLLLPPLAQLLLPLLLRRQQPLPLPLLRCIRRQRHNVSRSKSQGLTHPITCYLYDFPW